MHIIILLALRIPKGKKSGFFFSPLKRLSTEATIFQLNILDLGVPQLHIENTASTFKCLVLFSHILFQVTFLLINSLT